MKYIKLIILSIVCCFSAAAMADDYELYANRLTLDEGTESSSLNIYMKNVATISAVQFDITFPEGIDIHYGKNTDGDMAYFIQKGERAKTDHTVSYKKLFDRSYRIMITSPTNATFKETEANRGKPVAIITLDIEKDINTGEHSCSITNIVLSHYDSENASHPYYPSESTISVLVNAPFPLGDINRDGAVSIADMTTLIDILSKPNATENTNDDINDDGSVDVLDIESLQNILLEKNK